MNALEPSWKSIRIKPFIPEDMDYVSASLNTIRGPLHVSWEKLSDVFKFVCQIPLGSITELWFPKNNKGTSLKEGKNIVWEQGKEISNDHIEFLEEHDDFLLFKLGSGHYEFKLEM
jgi:alpha-L-rhamnosidase